MSWSGTYNAVLSLSGDPGNGGFTVDVIVPGSPSSTITQSLHVVETHGFLPVTLATSVNLAGVNKAYIATTDDSTSTHLTEILEQSPGIYWSPTQFAVPLGVVQDMRVSPDNRTLVVVTNQQGLNVTIFDISGVGATQIAVFSTQSAVYDSGSPPATNDLTAVSAAFTPDNNYILIALTNGTTGPDHILRVRNALTAPLAGSFQGVALSAAPSRAFALKIIVSGLSFFVGRQRTDNLDTGNWGAGFPSFAGFLLLPGGDTTGIQDIVNAPSAVAGQDVWAALYSNGTLVFAVTSDGTNTGAVAVDSSTRLGYSRPGDKLYISNSGNGLPQILELDQFTPYGLNIVANTARNTWFVTGTSSADYSGQLIGSSPQTPATSPQTPATSPHTPATSPQTPATSPQTPATSPQTPATSPQTPATSPQTPATSPQTPATSPQTPATSPQTPATSPQTPATSPQTPATSPQTPATSPQTPATSPQTPATSPQPPATSPQTPATSPQTPATSPQTPATSPHTPATSPQTPATSPQTPATSPQTPATSPQTPATSPQTPATSPGGGGGSSPGGGGGSSPGGGGGSSPGGGGGSLFPIQQTSPPLTPSDATANAEFGSSVDLTADGNTMVVGGFNDNSGVGAAWVYTRSGTSWFDQTPAKLVGSGAVGAAEQGISVAIAPIETNTIIVGGSADNSSAGAAWIFVRSSGGSPGGVWTQQGAKLVGTGATGTNSLRGVSVVLSGDGNTALVGGRGDANGFPGAAWAFTRSGSPPTWSQQGGKIFPSDGTGGSGQAFGAAVDVSDDGNTAAIGGYADGGNVGAVWVYTRSGGVWSEQQKLVGTGNTGTSAQGSAVAISGDGNTILVGAQDNNGGVGACWVFIRGSGSPGGMWTQQAMLLGSPTTTNFGIACSLTSDGHIALIGAANGNSGLGPDVWFAFVRTGGLTGTWTQGTGPRTATGLVNPPINPGLGLSVSVSEDGHTAAVGAQFSNGIGAVVVYV